MTDRVDINRLLSDMRSLKAQTQVFQRPQINPAAEVNPFLTTGAAKVDQVNQTPSFGY
jgi:flagellar hook-basal body complex protein FliE